MLPHVQNPLLLPPCTKVRLSPITSRYQSLRSLSAESIGFQTVAFTVTVLDLVQSFLMALPIGRIVR